MNDMIIGQPQAGASPATLIKDSDIKGFMADVIEASRKVPVIVDFWAPWCGPCKQLTPILEKVVKQAGGKVRLVKINVDENQQIAAQLRVQSIPAVFAFVDGQPIDGFMGALPESQIRQFIDKLGSKGSLAEQIASAVEAAVEAMARKDFQEALGIFSQILDVDPTNISALANLAKCHIELGDLDAAAQVLSSVPPDKVAQSDVVSARAALDLALNPVDTSIIGGLQARLEKNPDDFEKRLELAVALNGIGERDQATDHLLYIVRRKRDWNEDAARKQLVKFFEIWGPKDQHTLAGRRKLSAILFA